MWNIQSHCHFYPVSSNAGYLEEYQLLADTSFYSVLFLCEGGYKQNSHSYFITVILLVLTTVISLGGLAQKAWMDGRILVVLVSPHPKFSILGFTLKLLATEVCAPRFNFGG
jgi:lysylphosphatidylglycerol synthetase-like protein (DUF2156 family)